MNLRKYVPEFIVLVYAVLFLLTKNPSNEWDRVIVSDGKGYYAYLTALFIYQDTDYGFTDRYEAEYYPASRQLYKDFRYDTGKGIVNKYFPGPAILWLPFFATGHAAAALLGYPADGYSLPYQWAIAIAAFFYLWLALLVLRKIIRFYTKNENSIAWLLISVALATNLIYYTVNAGSQVHVYNFFLINAFIYFVLAASKWEKPLYFFSAAFMLGMIVISRPQNGLIVFAIPFLCGSKEFLVLFIKNLFGKIRILLPSLLFFLLPLIIPVSYWYFKTGHFLVYSYGNESFNLTKPHLLQFLFSFEKGWLLYTPVAAFASLGLVFLFRKSKFRFYSLTAFLFLVVYVLSSWWVWNYTSYISQRVMIDYYAFTAILLAFIFVRAEKSNKRLWIKIVLGGFIALNLMQHFQQLNWIYPAGPVTAKTYFGNFFSFSKGTTFMIPEDDVRGKQSFINDFENNKPLFISEGLTFSASVYDGEKALEINPSADTRILFIRGLSDYKDIQPVILRIGAWFNPISTDSSLSLTVSVGNSKDKYSFTEHNLMPGLKTGKWRYAEMAVYLPYARSISDSLFISMSNFSKANVLADNLQVDFLKMQGPKHLDWILAPDDQVDSAILFRTDLETPPEAPFANTAGISEIMAYSGIRSSVINPDSPFSVGFESELTPFGSSDGYIRVSSRIVGDRLSEVLLVFDFSSEGKTVLYKTYQVTLPDNNSSWNHTEVFRELPVASLKAKRVKIYYWYTKGGNPVYIDDLQVDMVKYRKAHVFEKAKFLLDPAPGILEKVCTDFEQQSTPASGTIIEVPNASSGKNVCVINNLQPFSSSFLFPLAGMQTNPDAFLFINARFHTDRYMSGATLVADFRQNGKSAAYSPDYMRGRTIKGGWNNIDFSVKIPEGITSQDSVLVYFYLPGGDEECWIDDFCISLRKPNSVVNTKKLSIY